MFSLTTLPFLLLLAAVLGLWLHRAVWITALVLAVAAGYYSGALVGLAALWIAIAALLAWSYARTRERTNNSSRILRWVLALAFFTFAIALFLPALPGFVRVVLVEPQVLSPGAEPYGISVGFPKVVTGILILGLINPAVACSWRELGVVLARALPVLLFTTVCVSVFAVAAGYTAFAPHWTELFLLWAPINLFFTCLAEEALFRGFVQHELAKSRAQSPWLPGLALVIAAVLFGLAHFKGGATYVAAGTIAGLGYGWAWHRTQRIEAAMAVHFGVNAVHFLWFVYPRLA
jgi:uncharacterized protein